MGSSRLCLTVAEKTIEEDVKQVQKFAQHIDMVELRADFLETKEYGSIPSFPKVVRFPSILTMRSRAHGGHFLGSERERQRMIRMALGAGFAFIDREEGTEDPRLDQQIEDSGARIIRSFHDFEGVPDDLAARILKLLKRKTELPKATVMPGNTGDLLKIAQCAQALRNQQKILLGMGDFGLLTRLLAPVFDSYLSYCSPPGMETAPGHLDPELLDTLFRFREIDARTEIFAVIGNPIKHSISPQIHNKGYADLGLNAVYVPVLVDSLRDFFQLAEILRMGGFSVTIPHKQGVLDFLTERDESVTQIGACNTVIRRQNGWEGKNTDVSGFLAPLRKVFAGEIPAGLKATVIGAGGAARAVVYALVKNRFDVLILNRTEERAQHLARDFRCRWGGYTAEGITSMRGFSELIVQTTSVGMVPNTQADLLSDFVFTGDEIVYELVYKPHETKFLKRAAKAGCRIIHGLDMLYEQAYDQFFLFTGREYPQALRAKNNGS